MLKKIRVYLFTNAIKLAVLLFAFLCFQTSYAADSDSVSGQQYSVQADYSKGMQSYLNGDFERSQVYWLSAAKKNDARSMFNLGLLHEQGKISGAEMEKAENWYRLAGKHGYAAADYHLAKLKMSNSPQDNNESNLIQALLERSANNNFAPAKNALRNLAADTSVDLSNLDKSYVNENSSVKSNYLTEDFIVQKQSSNWTIQILAFEQEDKVRSFIDRHNLNSSAAYFTETSQGNILYKLIYGSYQTKEDADKARSSLALELKEHGPWLRTVASVQTLINAN